jgi:hypothetical protein
VRIYFPARAEIIFAPKRQDRIKATALSCAMTDMSTWRQSELEVKPYRQQMLSMQGATSQ